MREPRMDVEQIAYQLMRLTKQDSLSYDEVMLYRALQDLMDARAQIVELEEEIKRLKIERSRDA